MLTRDTRDPATLPRLLLSLLALALLWPGIHFSELDLGVLLKADSQSEMGRFVSAFWPPAHGEEFLQLLWQATLQTLAIATAGMALALLRPCPPACSPVAPCRCRPPHVVVARAPWAGCCAGRCAGC